ncbi:energy transducer TonB [Pseudoalteromonas sp. KG3]|uniref:Energy transducer TonB n=1 Tax=Pseudoalteromonas prydzensis TaxID=182141 RepID=A0ABR9FMS1_9GAMM|nr:MULTISPECIES: energy transducer TonB [Pseudoalteromonas]MBE0458123.1 energy transducer TonB [Pseudoalteromonas prydzensis]WKD22438.1 energy transducer TonB [Pseudoalteromonas sp. KG3]
MKTIVYCASLIFSFAAFSQSNDISDKRPIADIQAQYLDQQGVWQRLQKIPNHEYPLELLNIQGKGCAETSFVISKSGTVKDIKINNTDPIRYGRQLQTATRQLVRKWHWPEQEQQVNLTMRFDYCFDSDLTRDEIINYCIKQSEQVCS